MPPVRKGIARNESCFLEFNQEICIIIIIYLFPDLKKHFEVPPYSQQVALGSQVQMRCHPPKGKPAPTIKWLQNGSPISPLTDKNFIITGEGHLIVVNATLADTANYTCVAENVATKRLSAPATINVYGKAYLCKKRIHFRFRRERRIFRQITEIT